MIMQVEAARVVGTGRFFLCLKLEAQAVPLLFSNGTVLVLKHRLSSLYNPPAFLSLKYTGFPPSNKHRLSPPSKKTLKAFLAARTCSFGWADSDEIVPPLTGTLRRARGRHQGH